MHRQQVYRFLRDKIYAGIICTKLTDWHDVPAAFAPLIPRETFDRVQTVLSGSSQHVSHHRTRAEFPLRGLLLCSNCSRPLTASFSRGKAARYAYYHCHNRACPSPQRLPKGKAETAVTEYLKRITIDVSPVLRLFREIVLDVWQNEQAGAIAARTAAQHQLSTAQQKYDRLLNAHISGLIDDKTFRSKAAEIQIEIATAKTRAHDSEIDELDAEAVLDMAAFALTNAEGIYSKLTPAAQTRFLGVLTGGEMTIDATGIVRTPASGGIINGLSHFSRHLSQMATPTGRGWNTFRGFLQDAQELYSIIAEVA
jgi:hypothetical protein